MPCLRRALPRAASAPRQEGLWKRVTAHCDANSFSSGALRRSFMRYWGRSSSSEHTEPLCSIPRSVCSAGRAAAGAACHCAQSRGDGPWQQIAQLSALRMPFHTSYHCLVLLWCPVAHRATLCCFTFHVLAALLSLCPHQVLPGSSTCVFPWENVLFLCDKGKAWDKPPQYSKINRGWEKISVWSSPGVRSVEQIGSWMPHSPFF